ncbi:hypothetical protein F0227_03480 [Vibrio sp. 99-8-1]|nr:hypothetical protein [Vibrio sp. 99-8-1]
MEQASAEMSSEYTRIQRRTKEDSGTAGDQGEENWAELLENWLPSNFHIVTKGRIIGHDGKTSPQIDVLVLKSSYPRRLLSKKLYLAAGVLAAFECKNTLKANHIKEAVCTSKIVKSLAEVRSGTPFKELHSPIIYGVLAHSHSWKEANSTPIKNIQNKVTEEDKRLVTHPSQSIDLLCVADLGTWSLFKYTYVDMGEPKYNSGLKGTPMSGYVGFTNKTSGQGEGFTPIGSLIFNLSQRLAWESPEIRSLADYYRCTNLSGVGEGSMRSWSSAIYSNYVREKVERGNYSEFKSWDEWASQFFTS